MNFKSFWILSIYTIWDGLSLKTTSRYCPFKPHHWPTEVGWVRNSRKIFPRSCNWACTLRNPCCGGWKISVGRLLLINLLGWDRRWRMEIYPDPVPKTHTKRQAIQRGYLPNLLVDGDKGLTKYTVRKKYFVLGRPEQPRHATIFCYVMTSPTNQPRKDQGPLSFVLTESPFTSVSAVSRGHPSLVSPSLAYIRSHFLLIMGPVLNPCNTCGKIRRFFRP
jgi:hypothetical protein